VGLDPNIIYVRFADITKRGRSLWKKIDLSTLTQGATIDIRYGDVNGNNVIEGGLTGADRLFITSRNGAVVQMEHNDPATTSTYKYDIGADINRDLIVNPLDTTILVDCYDDSESNDNLGASLNQ
jgi:hypothetical protein